MGLIEIRNLRKSLGGISILNGVNLSVETGTTVVILGKSGTGKSVLLKCIIGLLAPDAGSICVMGQEVVALDQERLNTLRTSIGFLFQNSALFDSMSVYDNLAFPLRRMAEVPEEQIGQRVVEQLRHVGLEAAIHKMPSELSGGMKKRIGLARALIANPRIMLYDEPTTGLDPISAREISSLILELGKRFETTSIAVTHDLSCARMIADKVAVLDGGTIRQEGSIESLEHVDDAFVKNFLANG